MAPFALLKLQQCTAPRLTVQAVDAEDGVAAAAGVRQPTAWVVISVCCGYHSLIQKC